MTHVLQSNVLVLNKHWKPIATTTVYKAVCKVFQAKAAIVGSDYGLYSFDEWVTNWSDAITMAKQAEAGNVIPCVSFSLVAPEVIVVRNYGGFAIRKARFSRKNIFERDNNTCQYCGTKGQRSELNIDHVVPRSKGGRSTWTNVVLACIRCNHKKDNQTVKEAGMVLRRKPFEPHWSQVRKVRGSVPRSWEDFLGKMYWDIELEND